YCGVCRLVVGLRLLALAKTYVPAGVYGPPLQTTIISVSQLYSNVIIHYASEGNTRRLLRESDDDETPQRTFFASEQADREPADSVVYFRSGVLCHCLYQIRGKSNNSLRWEE